MIMMMIEHGILKLCRLDDSMPENGSDAYMRYCTPQWEISGGLVTARVATTSLKRALVSHEDEPRTISGQRWRCSMWGAMHGAAGRG